MPPPLFCRVLCAFWLIHSFARGEAPADRTDLYGDPLPAGAVARMGTMRGRHTADVDSIVFSPDGKLIASTCDRKGDGVHIWNAATRREVRRIQVTGDIYARVHAFTPDSKALLLDADDVLALHDVSTGRQLRRFPTSKKRLRGVALSRDGKYLAYGGDGPILRICDPASGREVRQLHADDEGVWCVALTADGKLLATASRGNTLRLWDVASGKCVRTLRDNRCFAVAFAPDGRALAWDDDAGAIRLRDVVRGRIIRNIKEQKGSIFYLIFAPDGKLLTSGRGGQLHLWDPMTGAEHPHTKDKWVAASCAAFAPDGKTLALSHKHALRLWDVDKGRDTPSPAGHEDVVERLTVAPDGRSLFSGGQDGTIRHWDMSTGRPRRVWSGESSFALAPDGQTFAAADGEQIILRETKTGRQRSVLQRDMLDSVIRMAYSPDGQRLAVGSFQQVQVWDIAANKRLQRLSHPSPETQDSSTFPLHELFFRGRHPCLLTLPAEEGFAALWDVEDGAHREMFVERGWGFGATALSPDCKTLAIICKSPQVILQLWEIAADKERARFESNVKFTGPLAQAPDGRTVAATHEDGGIRLWSVITGAEIRCLRNPIAVTAMTFAPDGKALITAHADTTILVWDVSAAAGRNDFVALPRLDLEKAWKALAGDADKAHAAIWQLVADPKRSVPFLAERLHAAAAPPRDKVARWIADLDSDEFATRQRAAAELKRCGDTIVQPLRAALRDKPSLEMRLRLEPILESARGWSRPLAGERLRAVRAVEVLEHIGTAEAQRLLAKWAAGAESACLTEDAQAALARLQQRRRVQAARPLE